MYELLAELTQGAPSPSTAASDPLDHESKEYLQALCELLEIENRKDAEPIILVPSGPVVLH